MKDVIEERKLVTRVEVISQNGRDYVNVNCSEVQVAIQDNGRTMKVFIKNNASCLDT